MKESQLQIVPQNTRSTSRAEEILAHSSGERVTIYELVGNEYRRCETHKPCENARVWDWPRYEGGACPDCENKFKGEWERKLKDLTVDTNWYLHLCGVGKRHWKCTVENFKGSETVKKACRAIIDNPADTFLTGPPGTGKTHLASGMVRGMVLNGLVFQLYHEQPRAIFITVPDLLLKIRATFGKREGDSEDDIVERLRRVPILFLDDLGAEKPSEWVSTTLYTIIDARYREERPTITTSNLDLNEIAGQLHPRIASRLSSGKIIKLTGTDYRGRRTES